MIEIKRTLLNEHIRNISQEEILNILNSIPKTNIKDKKYIKDNNYIKGQEGEKMVYDMIKGFEKERKNSHSGDLIIYKKEYPNIKLMIEVKNYSSAIPYSMYSKFLEEIKINNYNGGIFVCNQPITSFASSTGSTGSTGSTNITNNGYTSICGYDEQILNFLCESIWIFIFRELNFKCLDSDGKLNKYCDSLIKDIYIIHNINIDLLNYQKNTNLLMQKLQSMLTLTSASLKNTTNKIISKLSGQRYNSLEEKFKGFNDYEYFGKLPENTQQNLIKLAKNFINKEKVLIQKNNKFLQIQRSTGSTTSEASSTNNVEFMIFKFLKTKIVINFEHIKFDLNLLVKSKNIEFKSGLIQYNINDIFTENDCKNILSNF